MASPAPRVSSITVDAEPENLATLRDRVTEVAASCGTDVGTVEDIRLVVSELATNVIQHTSSQTITVGLEFADDVVVLDVLDAEGVESTTGRAEAVRSTERCLGVVRAVMDTVELVEHDGTTRIRCTKRTRS